MLFNLLQTAGLDSTDFSAAAQAAAQAVPHEEEMHLLEMATKGGWLMLVLLALSIIAIYIFGKKWWMIHQASTIDANFMRDIRDYIREGKIKSAQSLCERFDSPVARLVEKACPVSDVLSLTSRPPSRTPATQRWQDSKKVFLSSPRYPAARL